ncbi:MAG: dihydroorotate dehydrogenase electron transfer subunit [Planctomycetaceae bacterium]
MNAFSATSQSLPGLVRSATHIRAEVVSQRQLALDTYCLRVRCPEIAKQITPGQFFMIRLPGETDPLLGRPFALYDVFEENGQPAGIDFGYVVIGKMTSLLPRLTAGDAVEIWGPLGNGFPVPTGGRLMLVAGGIGQTPFLAVAREALGLRTYGSPARRITAKPDSVSLCYGVRSKEYLAGVEEFAAVPGLNLQLATDDGSHGRSGFVTALLSEALQSNTPPTSVYVCGPEPMMHAAAKLCAKHDVNCWLSLESPMACGFGACFSCVTRVRQPDGTWDYRRTCVEGPVFPARELVF